MHGGPAREARRNLEILFRLGVTGDLSDGQLLERFVASRDTVAEEAFAVLVRRHGPMVLGVCRRVLSSSHEADDAFQTTFFVLARKAGMIARRESVANWLYGVALRTAKDARARARRRRAWEQKACTFRVVPAPGDGPAEELRTILDEELSRLPARLRTPLLLCELESLSRHEAAKRLHIPEGTLSSRLARAKSLLRERLTRRGLGLPLAVLSTMLVTEAQSSMVPYALAEVTVRAAALLAAGCSLSGLVSAPVYSMFTEVLRAMMFAKIKGVAVGRSRSEPPLPDLPCWARYPVGRKTRSADRSFKGRKEKTRLTGSGETVWSPDRPSPPGIGQAARRGAKARSHSRSAWSQCSGAEHHSRWLADQVVDRSPGPTCNSPREPSQHG